MTYTAESHIKTVSDVKTFFHHLANECRISFHPDDDFAEYTYMITSVFFRTKKRLFIIGLWTNRLMFVKKLRSKSTA